MALPVIAVGSVLGILAVVAKYLQAAFAAIQAGLNAVIAWFTAHKIIFSLFLMAVFVGLWGLVYAVVYRVGDWALGVSLGSVPDFEILSDGVSYLSEFVAVSKIVSLLSFTVAFYFAEIVIHQTIWAYSAMRAFVLFLAHTFRG